MENCSLKLARPVKPSVPILDNYQLQLMAKLERLSARPPFPGSQPSVAKVRFVEAENEEGVVTFQKQHAEWGRRPLLSVSSRWSPFRQSQVYRGLWRRVARKRHGLESIEISQAWRKILRHTDVRKANFVPSVVTPNELR